MAELRAPTTTLALPSPPAPRGSTTPAGEEAVHELRVRIPVDLHRQLLSLKILRGKSLAETVSQALDLYFVEHAEHAKRAVATAEVKRG